MNFFINKLNSKIYIFKYQTLFFYLSFIFLIVILSLVYSNLFIDKFPFIIDEQNNIQIQNIQFDYGELINNLYLGKGYFQEKHGIIFHTLRLPLLPFLLVVILKITKNFYLFLVIKNFFIFTVFFILTIIIFKRLKLKYFHLLTLYFIFLYNPYNVHVLLSFQFADFITSILLPCLFLSLLINKKLSILLISLILFFLYFTKSAISIFCIIFGCIYLFLNLKNSKNKLIKYFPICTVLLSAMIWSYFGKKNSNFYAIGSNVSSYNSYALSSLLNKDFKNYYPFYSVDLLLLKKPEKLGLNNEKEFSEYFAKKNTTYLKDNKYEYFIGVIKKISFIAFYIYKDGNLLDSKKEIMISSIFNRIIFIISIIYALHNIFIKKELLKINIYFLFIVITYLLPLLIGWATNKHLVPIFLISHIFLFLYQHVKDYSK